MRNLNLQIDLTTGEFSSTNEPMVGVHLKYDLYADDAVEPRCTWDNDKYFELFADLRNLGFTSSQITKLKDDGVI